MLGVPPPLTAVSDAVLAPEANVGFALKVADGLIAATAPTMLPIAMLSVAPLFADWEYKVALTDEDVSVTTAPDEVAVTPRVERVVSALMAFLSAVAIEVVESPLYKVYLTFSAWLNPLS